MANAIKKISVQRGYDVTRYVLSTFGGAGGQHACAVADALGMTSVLIHPLAGALSAYGIGLADVIAMRESAVEAPLTAEPAAPACRPRSSGPWRSRPAPTWPPRARPRAGIRGDPPRPPPLRRHRHPARGSVRPGGGDDRRLRAGLPQPLLLPDARPAHHHRGGLGAAAVAAAPRPRPRSPSRAMPPRPRPPSRRHAPPSATAPAARRSGASPSRPSACACSRPGSGRRCRCTGAASCRPGRPWTGPRSSPRTWRRPWSSPAGGPRSPTGSTCCSPASRRMPATATRATTEADPVLLEVFCNLFMAVAEQMGERLRSTAHSVNIKERLDFSCAIFDADGGLIANAPHIPVHLGSMGESIKMVIDRNKGRIKPGDVYALNDPYHGGTHLPDVTVVTPVFPPRRRRRSPAPRPERVPPRHLVLRRLPRPSRRDRRHVPRLDARREHPHRGGGRAHRQLAAGRGRPAARSGDQAPAHQRRVPVAEPGHQPRRPARPGRRQREGRRGAPPHGRAARPRRDARLHGPRPGERRRGGQERHHRARPTASCAYELDNGATIRVEGDRRPERQDRHHRLHRHEPAARRQLQRPVERGDGRRPLRVPHAGRQGHPAERRLPASRSP